MSTFRLELAPLTDLDGASVGPMFDFQIRDFSTYAVALHGEPISTRARQDWAAVQSAPTKRALTASGICVCSDALANAAHYGQDRLRGWLLKIHPRHASGVGSLGMT